MAEPTQRFGRQVSVCLHLFLTFHCNVHPGAVADPVYVSGWMKRSCLLRAGELLGSLDFSLLQPVPPGEHAASLNIERIDKTGEAQWMEREGKTELK